MEGLTGPKYLMIKEYLKTQLTNDRISYGQQLPSEYKLMEKFGVSRHTVRKALDELEIERYIYKEQGKGSFCNYIEGENQKKVVAVVTTFISDYIFPQIISGIEEILSNKGYPLLLSNTNSQKTKERQYINNIINYEPVGLIIEPTKSAAENVNFQMFEQLKRKNIKMVFLNAVYNDDDAYLIVNDYKGCFLVTDYLLTLGHRNIAGLFKTDDKQGVQRKQGFISAFEKMGLPVNLNLIGEYDSETKYEFPYVYTRSLLQQTEKPTAIVCYNDEIARMVINTAREISLSVPEDLSVVGFDDSNLAAGAGLTSVTHPKKEMGKEAARFLICMLEGSLERPQKIYQPELIIRQSCRRLD
jgi:GntR family transcriptional regulator of arabinose operon